MDIAKIQEMLAKFAKERDWDQFHNPKNLAMALAGEAGELLEIFQWLTEEQASNIGKEEKGREKVEEEIADILIYALRLCDKLSIDLEDAVKRKIAINNEKYPVNLSRGNATKYSER